MLECTNDAKTKTYNWQLQTSHLFLPHINYCQSIEIVNPEMILFLSKLQLSNDSSNNCFNRNPEFLSEFITKQIINSKKFFQKVHILPDRPIQT